jgi:hypothetical protein
MINFSLLARIFRFGHTGARKTDRLDTELLIRVFLDWLRGEKRHCSMVATRVTALRPG